MIDQDLVDRFGFVAGYNSVKCFAGKVVAREPEQFDRLEFALKQRMGIWFRHHHGKALSSLRSSTVNQKTELRLAQNGHRHLS